MEIVYLYVYILEVSVNAKDLLFMVSSNEWWSFSLGGFLHDGGSAVDGVYNRDSRTFEVGVLKKESFLPLEYSCNWLKESCLIGIDALLVRWDSD